MTKRKNKNERSSQRLKHTITVAELCGFDYVVGVKNYYGGFFGVYELECMIRKLTDLKNSNDHLRDKSARLAERVGRLEAEAKIKNR